MKKFIIIAALVVVSVAAQAGESTPGAPTPSPSTMRPYGWTGVYGGLNGGFAIGTDSAYDLLAATGGVLGPPSSAFPGSFPAMGALLGGEIGANYQVGDIVLGAEADIDWSNAQGSYVDDPAAGPGASTVTGTAEWLATLRARVGYARDRWLLFATGGLAASGVKVGISNYTGAPSPYLADRQTLSGWTIGGGAEYALTDHWTIKGEYLYVDLNDRTFAFRDPSNLCGCAAPGGVVAEAKGKADMNLMRIAIGYKF
jgi:outer membrane immunogenic protein